MVNEKFDTAIFPNESRSVIQTLSNSILTDKKVQLDIKREDLIHPYLSGNKWRKLKYNLIEAKNQGFDKLLTFGGAYSNHIYATAAAGKLYGFETIGIIRGDELEAENATLTFAKDCGMQLKFVSRDIYRQKTDLSFINSLQSKFKNFYLLPEGGTNDLAIKGCEEILSKNDFENYDFVALMIGTGGTFCGIVNKSAGLGHILGISALKGEFIKKEIENLGQPFSLQNQHNFTILTQYHHGGYAKSSPILDQFIQDFYLNHGIPLEFVYTGKLLFALMEMIKDDYFPKNTKILAIHTGGLRPNT